MESPLGVKLGEFAGAPRSFLWKRGAVHLRRAEGCRAIPDLHAHFAIQLTVGITHEVQLRIAREAPARAAAGWLIASDQPHWGRGQGAVATIFWDPISPEGRRVSTLLHEKGVLPLQCTQASLICHKLGACWDRGWAGPDLRAAVERIAALLAPEAAISECLDWRIQKVVDALVAKSNQNTSLADLAALVGLSESRLAHLFQQEVGIPMRQYRLTLRMQDAVTLVVAGKSFTEAAHMAGFADSAHFSRICRRMFGSAPSGLPAFQAE